MKTETPRSAASALTSLVILVLCATGPSAAQSVSVEDVASYLGTWKLAITFQGNPAELTLEIAEEDGAVKAALSAAITPEPQLIESISKTAEGLLLGYEANFGGNALAVEVRVALEGDDRMVGTFGDVNGLFSADFTGERASASAGVLADAEVAAAAAAEAPSPRRRGPARVNLDLGSGKELRVLHGRLEIDSDDHASLLATEPGEVFTYAGSRAIKLLTDADLVFGDTRVRAFNLAPNYPGCYAVWLKRVEDGWHLVFNEQADNWGSQYDPETDQAEVALAVDRIDPPREQLTVELEKAEGGGTLRIAWGDTAWSAQFRAE